MHRVTACKAEGDYRLWLRFEDGLEGSVFLGNLLEIGAFQLWRDVREFEKVSVDPETGAVGEPVRRCNEADHPAPVAIHRTPGDLAEQRLERCVVQDSAVD